LVKGEVFTVKIHPPHPDPLPPPGGEGMIFMSGGDQIPVMMVWGLVKGEIFRGYFRIACRQVSENSRTFPPLKKGGQGGFLYYCHGERIDPIPPL
jgi:hypothetical protein